MFLIQDAFRKYSEMDKEVDAILELNLPFQTFGILPFTSIVTGLDTLPKYVIIRGGTKVLDIITNDTITGDFDKQIFKEGLFYNPTTFDQAYYQTLDLPSLNENADIHNMRDIIDVKFEQAFVKPSNDRKSFNALFVDNQTIREALELTQYQANYLDQTCLLTTEIVEINRECRFYIVNQHVITGSHYRIDNQTKHLPIQAKDIMWQVANEYCKLFQPHDVFVIDIAETPIGFKIVEYNCLNASGLYTADVKKLFKELINYKENI